MENSPAQVLFPRPSELAPPGPLGIPWRSRHDLDLSRVRSPAIPGGSRSSTGPLLHTERYATDCDRLVMGSTRSKEGIWFHVRGGRSTRDR